MQQPQDIRQAEERSRDPGSSALLLLDEFGRGESRSDGHAAALDGAEGVAPDEGGVLVVEAVGISGAGGVDVPEQSLEVPLRQDRVQSLEVTGDGGEARGVARCRDVCGGFARALLRLVDALVARPPPQTFKVGADAETLAELRGRGLRAGEIAPAGGGEDLFPLEVPGLEIGDRGQPLGLAKGPPPGDFLGRRIDAVAASPPRHPGGMGPAHEGALDQVVRVAAFFAPGSFGPPRVLPENRQEPSREPLEELRFVARGRGIFARKERDVEKLREEGLRLGRFERARPGEQGEQNRVGLKETGRDLAFAGSAPALEPVEREEVPTHELRA